jgi:phenylacetate-CoA ligase
MKVSPHFPENYNLLSTKALETAIQHVPVYKEWKALDPGSSVAVDERFQAMPAISKRDLREHTWRNFIPQWADIDAALQSGTIELVNTSGTIEERITNVWYQPWWDASEAASWRYNSHTAALKLGNHREAILTSPMNTGILSENSLLTLEQRSLGRFLYLNEKINPALWDGKLIERIIRELEIFQPTILEANPSYLAKVARYAHRHDLQVFQPPVITLTYENPGILSRGHIQKAFRSPLVSSYGSTEAGYVFMECEQGKLHQVSSCCRVDVEFMRPEYGYPYVGRLLLTTLTNPWRSLIRFDVGDLVQIDPAGACACGHDDGYVGSEFAGRIADLTYTTDGAPVTTATIESIMAGWESVAEYQVFQQDSIYNINIVLDEEATASKSLKEKIIERLLSLYGRSAVINVRFVEKIETEPSGKYRLTRSNISVNIDRLFVKGDL